jgi:hypothetical protein
MKRNFKKSLSNRVNEEKKDIDMTREKNMEIGAII